MLNHHVLDRLDSALRDIVPAEPIEVRGEWSTAVRRTYKSGAQGGTGRGPFVDVVDARWRGALTAASSIAAIAFLATAHDLYWVKSPDAAPTLPVDVSLHAYAASADQRATFTASLAGAYLPGVPTSVGPDLSKACALGPEVLATGRVTCIARTQSAAVLVLLIQRGILTVGRKRLWRLRDEVAASLPPDVRELLTRRRTGHMLKETSHTSNETDA